MSKSNKTMSHTDEQRKEWHKGKLSNSNGIRHWFRTMIANKNFKGAHTPVRHKKGMYYMPLKLNEKLH